MVYPYSELTDGVRYIIDEVRAEHVVVGEEVFTNGKWQKVTQLGERRFRTVSTDLDNGLLTLEYNHRLQIRRRVPTIPLPPGGLAETLRMLARSEAKRQAEDRDWVAIVSWLDQAADALDTLKRTGIL